MNLYIPPGSQSPPEPQARAPQLDEGDDAPLPPAATLLDIALVLAARGLAVFPCAASKRPAIAESAGGRGCLDATTDPDQVRALFARAPNVSLVGVACGPASGVDILDIDPRHGGDLWECENRDCLPETLIHSTRGGGQHHVFRHHPGVRNRQGVPTPGVDVRGEGGYAIWPPSDGYAVVHDVEPAEWPQWLLEQIIRTEPSPRPIVRSNPAEISDARLDGLLRSLLARLSQAPEGQKHEVLLRIARTIGGYAHVLGQSDDQLVALMLSALPDTVLDWRNAEKTARDGLGYGRAAPLELENRPGRSDRHNGPTPPGGGPPPGELPPPEGGPPPRDEDNDFVLPIEFSENMLAYLFSDQHAEHLVYVHGWGKWLRWDAGRWREDFAVAVFDEARKICAKEGERARRTLPSRFADKVASAINKAACVAAIERLARHHAPQVRPVEVFDADPMLLNAPDKSFQLKGN